MRWFASRRLMTNPVAVNKCANAGAAMRCFVPSALREGAASANGAGARRRPRVELREIPDWPLTRLASGEARHPLPQAERAGAHFFAPLACLMQSERNFLRSLPCNPFSSACFEQSSDSGLRAFSVFSVLAAGAEVAGAVPCAKAELAGMREAKAATAAREEIVIMETPMGVRKEAQACAARMNPT